MRHSIHKKAGNLNRAHYLTPDSGTRLVSTMSDYGSTSNEVEDIALRLMEKKKPKAVEPKPVTIRKFSWEV
jgi:hypothetical protein